MVSAVLANAGMVVAGPVLMPKVHVPGGQAATVPGAKEAAEEPVACPSRSYPTRRRRLALTRPVNSICRCNLWLQWQVTVAWAATVVPQQTAGQPVRRASLALFNKHWSQVHNSCNEANDLHAIWKVFPHLD